MPPYFQICWQRGCLLRSAALGAACTTPRPVPASSTHPPALPAHPPQQDPAARPTARELHALLLACPCLADEDSSRSPPTPNEGSLGSREVSTEAPTAGAATARALGEAQASGASSLERVGATGSGTGGGNSGSASLSSPLASSELGLITLDLSKIEFCTNPNGSRQELGRGSFGAVYRALLEGVQPLAAKVCGCGALHAVMGGKGERGSGWARAGANGALRACRALCRVALCSSCAARTMHALLAVRWAGSAAHLCLQACPAGRPLASPSSVCALLLLPPTSRPASAYLLAHCPPACAMPNSPPIA